MAKSAKPEAPDSVSIRFRMDHDVPDGIVRAKAGNGFRAGRTYTMSAASAAHHVLRGHADYATSDGGSKTK